MVSAKNEIELYFQCSLCMQELMELEIEQSPQEYQQIEVGWTKKGLQVWCKRHDCNIVHIDFEGQKHPANCEIALEGE